MAADVVAGELVLSPLTWPPSPSSQEVLSRSGSDVFDRAQFWAEAFLFMEARTPLFPFLCLWLFSS